MLKQFTVLLALSLTFSFNVQAQSSETATETKPAETNVQEILAAKTIKLRRGISDDINMDIIKTPEEEQKEFVRNVDAYHKRIGAEEKIVPVTDVKNKDQMRRYIKKAVGMEDIIVNPASLEDAKPVDKPFVPGKYTSKAAEALQ